jgi:serine/threonine protein kinase
VSEVDLFLAYREEIGGDDSAQVLRHLLNCETCLRKWRRFEKQHHVASGIGSALLGDVSGADSAPGFGKFDHIPEELILPGFDIESGYIEGGQARVYRGVDRSTQEQVAVKVFYDSPLNEGGNERFIRELQSLARLRHPHVVPIRSNGIVSGHTYFVMPWIDGSPLDQHIKTKEVTIRDRIRLMMNITDAVAHAHRRGVLHLDLKPSNVRVDSSGAPVVLDFGLAKLMDAEADSQIPSMGAAGTPHYMAPEQILNRDDIDVRADVYGLGLLLYEILTGCRARSMDRIVLERDAETIAATLPPDPRSINRRISRELNAVVMTALATDPDSRYASAAELHADLNAILQGLFVSALRDHGWYRFTKWVSVYSSALLVAASFAGLVGVFMYLQIDQARTTRQLKQQNDELTYWQIQRMREDRERQQQRLEVQTDGVDRSMSEPSESVEPESEGFEKEDGAADPGVSRDQSDRE